MEFRELIGKTFTSINGAAKGSEAIYFTCADAKRYKMYHDQDCCERVAVEDVCGDISDLIGSPILKASEDTSDKNPDNVSAEITDVQDDSYTWTFYNIATAKGHVTLRWYGESNGYYSESVEIEETISEY